jgi:hypothetical protein
VWCTNHPPSSHLDHSNVILRKNLHPLCPKVLCIFTGTKLKKEKAQLLVNPQKVIKKADCELEKSDLEVLEDQNYVKVLGRNIQGIQLG